VIELYAREYARLEFERAELDFGQSSDDEALKRLKRLQRKLRKREFERHVAEQHGGPAVKRGATAIRLERITRKGVDIAKHFFSSLLSWRIPGGAAGRERKR
jgi:hypothetical protein